MSHSHSVGDKFTLVCEGRCSPETASYDAAVTEIQRGGAAEAAEGLDLAIRRARHLVHTTHSQLSLTRALCEKCGTIRLWSIERLSDADVAADVPDGDMVLAS